MTTLILRNGLLLIDRPVGANPTKFISQEGAGTPDRSCCCFTCCGFNAGNIVALTATIESDCTEIDGDTIAFTPNGSAGCAVRWIGGLSGTPTCFSSEWVLSCDCTQGGCDFLLERTIISGCQILLDSPNPVGFTCDPFELVFTGTVYEAAPASSCYCCTVGQAVTITITL